MTDKLTSALTEKGKAELYLSNLEKLKREGNIENLHYDALKSEYTRMLQDAESKINEEKSQTQKILDSKKKELAVAKLDMKYLEIRYKVGEMPPEIFDKKQREPQRRITELENTIYQLEKTIDASVNIEQFKPRPAEQPKKKMFNFSIGRGKKEEKSFSAPRPPLQERPVTPMPPPVERIEQIPDKPVEPVRAIMEVPIIEDKKPLPPGLLITNLDILPNRVAVGNHVGIIANLKNSTGSPIQHRVELRVNNELKDYRDVFLPPEQNEEITFMILTSHDGVFDIDVGGQKGKYTVLSSR
jgi:hypothetical protein